ncbi:MAG TPA: MFS transporter [Phycisphaerae bacterium]|nr:MFS transporter [Phycisphaerae bacterium]HRY69944.1 MFS transporter [Phycisphaerae bacterium]HSA27153.1 MFS transporter [Phycisphaerae bacterium]
MSEPCQLGVQGDIYQTKPLYRYLALLAALMAWGFDGVEQGVYTIMTRDALKDLVPSVSPLVQQASEMKAQMNGAGPDARGPLVEQLKTTTRKIDSTVGPFFSLSLAMWMWGAAAGGVLFGRMGDRWGRVRSMLVSVSLYASFTGLSALSTHWSHFITCRFIGAMGLGGTWPLCVALIVETWPEKHRAMLAGLIGAAANVGFFIAATYSKFMLKHDYEWRWVIGMGFFIAIISLPVIFLVPEPTQWKRSREKKERSRIGDLFTREYRRSTIVGSLLSTVALLGTWGAFLWVATYVDQITEGTPDQGRAKAAIAQWQSYGQMLGGFLGGLLAGWIGNKRSWCFLCLAAWASVVALFGLNRHYGLQMALMGALAGLFVTGFFGWLPKYLPELYPTRIRASGQGFSFNIGRVLTGFGVLGAGSLVSVFGGDYRWGAMTIATVYLLGLIVIAFAPDTGGKMLVENPQSPSPGPAFETRRAASGSSDADRR